MTVSQLISSYQFHRTVIAVISFAGSVIAARVVPAAPLATLLTMSFMAKFLMILNLGAVPGYFVSRYSGMGALANASPAAERRFMLLYFLQLTGLGLLVLVGTAIWFQQYLPGALAFLLIIPVLCVEPFLRHRRVFSFSLLPELMLSTSLIIVVGFFVIGSTADGFLVLYLSILAVTGVLTLAIVIRRHGIRSDDLAPANLSLPDYYRILLMGGPVFLASALFLLASSMDRLVLPLHAAPEAVNTYFLAYQLSLGAMIFVTAINFMNTVDLGHTHRKSSQIDPHYVWSKFKVAVWVALASLVALSVGALILERLVLSEDFAGLGLVTLVLGMGLAFFFVSNAITPLAAYLQRQAPLTVAMGVVTVALLGNNLFAYSNGLGPLWLASGTASALSIYAVFAVWFTFNAIRDGDKRKAAQR